MSEDALYETYYRVFLDGQEHERINELACPEKLTRQDNGDVFWIMPGGALSDDGTWEHEVLTDESYEEIIQDSRRHLLN
jgi:hypothetical protein